MNITYKYTTVIWLVMMVGVPMGYVIDKYYNEIKLELAYGNNDVPMIIDSLSTYKSVRPYRHFFFTADRRIEIGTLL